MTNLGMGARYLAASLLALCASTTAAQAEDRPNFLWITSEDNGPHLGCYGDEYADTPNLDALAARGMIFRNAWSTVPVCAPARTALITGMYPASTGSEHMRSLTRLPAGMSFFPELLRRAGYYCTNNSKEDYNLEKPGVVWDESSRDAHWRNREQGQPFFAVFNATVSHESQIRIASHELIHDPAKVRVPEYHPDTPQVRRDWAQYYDKLTAMDAQLGAHLDEIAAAGLLDDTIIFYFGDHGSGMPRSKRSATNSGLGVPLIVYVPEKFRARAPRGYATGSETRQMVSFVDFGPTVLSMAGIEPPEHMQGRAFAGNHAREPREYLLGFRGRMDERYDLVRVVRNERYLYVRNYVTHRPHGQHVAYQFMTPTTRVWHQLFAEGKLSAAQSHFWEARAYEELYDLDADPDETRNLAARPTHAETLIHLRDTLDRRLFAIRDVMFVPEPDLRRTMLSTTPYEFARNESTYPMKAIMETAAASARREDADVQLLAERLSHEDASVRYWAVTGLGAAGAVAGHEDALRNCLSDSSVSVQIAAAEALASHGGDDRERAVDLLFRYAAFDSGEITDALFALNAIDYLDGKVRDRRDRITALADVKDSSDVRYRGNAAKLLAKVLADLE